MWPPMNVDDFPCNYRYVEQSNNPHDHYHHHHFPHSSADHQECFQTLSCPSDLPIESSYYPPHHLALGPENIQYQELGQTNLSPSEYWCAEVECGHEKCTGRGDIPHEQNAIFEEISKECEHMLQKANCEKCNTHIDPVDADSLEMQVLVDIVAQAVDDITSKTENSGETQLLSKKRQQNKAAAARYRDKQKAKWSVMITDMEAEQSRNKMLKETVDKLEKEVTEWKEKFMKRVAGI